MILLYNLDLTSLGKKESFECLQQILVSDKFNSLKIITLRTIFSVFLVQYRNVFNEADSV